MDQADTQAFPSAPRVCVPMKQEGTLPPLCILAGGLGTRLGPIAGSLPKAMVSVAGRPFIDWLLDQAREQGFTDVVLLIGFRGAVLRDHVGNGSRFGLRVAYSDDGKDQLGTLGAIRKALPLVGEVVPVLYGDTYLAMSFSDMVLSHMSSASPATMSVLRNQGRGDTSNAVVSGGYVLEYSKKPPPDEAEWIDYGFQVFDRHLIETSLGSDLAALVTALARRGLVRAWPVSRFFHEIGTPEALRETEQILARDSGFTGYGQARAKRGGSPPR